MQLCTQYVVYDDMLLYVVLIVIVPNPMAAQQRTVTMDNVTLRLVIEWAGLGLRSQHRVNRYNNRPNNDIINNAAGTDPKIPKL